MGANCLSIPTIYLSADGAYPSKSDFGTVSHGHAPKRMKMRCARWFRAVSVGERVVLVPRRPRGELREAVFGTD
jgi:hypothetical protein